MGSKTRRRTIAEIIAGAITTFITMLGLVAVGVSPASAVSVTPGGNDPDPIRSITIYDEPGGSPVKNVKVQYYTDDGFTIFDTFTGPDGVADIFANGDQQQIFRPNPLLDKGYTTITYAAMNIINYEFVADATNRFVPDENGANYDLYLSDMVDLGEMLVTVTDPDGDPVEGAFISTKRDSDIYWKAAETDTTGTALITALAPGDYQVIISASSFRRYEVLNQNVNYNSTTSVNAQLNTMTGNAGPAINTFRPGGGDPTNNFGPGEQLDIVVSAAPGAISASFLVERTILGTQQIGTGALYETPTDSANAEYRGTFVIPTNIAGEYRVHTTITYAGGVEETNDLIIYIDPAGTVLDLHGAPVEGATVTLFHTLDSGSTWNAVPNGSAVMSPANRVNPWTSPANGSFAWDTAPGHYYVEATKGGKTAVTPELPVPPEHLGLILKLDLSDSVAPMQTAPSISGSLQVGETVTATTGAWDPVAGEDGNVQVLGMQWLRNGTPISGATGAEYTLTAADEGVVIGFSVTVGREGYDPYPAMEFAFGTVQAADADGEDETAGPDEPGEPGELGPADQEEPGDDEPGGTEEPDGTDESGDDEGAGDSETPKSTVIESIKPTETATTAAAADPADPTKKSGAWAPNGATGLSYLAQTGDTSATQTALISLALAMILLGTSVLRLRHRRIETQN